MHARCNSPCHASKNRRSNADTPFLLVGVVVVVGVVVGVGVGAYIVGVVSEDNAGKLFVEIVCNECLGGFTFEYI